MHLVASYEDPSLRKHVIDLYAYPELERALTGASTVNIPDVIHEPGLDPVQDALARRRVRSITVVPIAWRNVTIGALFLRTDRSRPALGSAEIRWNELVADVTERECAVLLEFVGRLLVGFDRRRAGDADPLIPKAGDAERDRLVAVALRVLEREAGA